MSSLTRRELARRRPGRSLHWPGLLLVLVVVAICVAALLVGYGGLSL